MKTKHWLIGLFFVAFAGVAVAQQNQVVTKESTTQQTNFVDSDNNGVCDNFNGQRQGLSRTNANNSGNGQGLHACQGKGKGVGLKDGNGKGKKQGKGQGRKTNYVDTNKNGTCDKRE